MWLNRWVHLFDQTFLPVNNKTKETLKNHHNAFIANHNYMHIKTELIPKDELNVSKIEQVRHLSYILFSILNISVTLGEFG